MSYQLQQQHLLWRAGFGPAAAQLTGLGNTSPQALFKALQKASAKKPNYINVAGNYLDGIAMGAGIAGMQSRPEDAEEKRLMRQKHREGIRSLNLAWMQEMTESSAQLREKLAFFWHGHFACRNLNVFYQQELLHIIRTHALGSFRTLLHEVSKSAAMLLFLNAAQNRKDHPNENFAREVMELFTLGRGHYTESDVKEAARAFTGWSTNLRGEAIFRPMQHDAGSKTILGKTAAFKGEDVLDLLLAQKQTALFITGKLCRFFVAEQADERHITVLANRFYETDYDIGLLMQEIFTSPSFYAAQNIGSRIKSPVELIVGMQRMLTPHWPKEEALLLLQRALGQTLFYPPNVAGWPGGRAWIDSSTLLMRMRLPLLIADADAWHIDVKSDDDQQMGQGTTGRWNKLFKADIDWQLLYEAFKAVPRKDLNATIAGYLLQTPTRQTDGLLKAFTDDASREAYISSVIIRLMASPEYQMC